MIEGGGEESGKSPDEELETIVVVNDSVADAESLNGIAESRKSGEGDQCLVEIGIVKEGGNCEETKALQRKEESIPQVFVNKPLCADYESSSDSESDSDSSTDSDSDTSSGDSDSDSSSQESLDDLREICDQLESVSKSKKKEEKTDLDLSDLPPIENLRISVPEEECQEIGTVASIVGTLVVVQAYKDSPALDLDTVLFLDSGKKSLGRIFDVLGPISEPVYTVRFNNVDDIAENNIDKGEKVYCAPKTEYTSFVFVSELMKMKGSDASWKNNEEAPPECQDFSDDEEENRHKYGEKRTGKSQSNPPDDGNQKRGKLKQRQPGRPANFQNPFALGYSRNRRFGQQPPRFSYSQPRFPRGNLNVYNHGMMMQTGFPMQPMYPYPQQQYPSYQMQQFAMPPVMPPPPPPPVAVSQCRGNSPRTPVQSWVFGSNIETPSWNG